MRLKDKLDKEVKQLNLDVEAKMMDIKALNLEGQKAREEQHKLEQQIRELKVSEKRHVLFIAGCLVNAKFCNVTGLWTSNRWEDCIFYTCHSH